MLTPAQVIPFLTHEESFVRSHAARYLYDAHDPSPVTADDAWAAIDRFGFADPLIDMLPTAAKLPQTDHSIARVLLEVAKNPQDRNIRWSLEIALVEIDFPTLLQQWDAIRNTPHVDADIVKHCAARIELQSEDPEKVWEKLVELALQLEDRDFKWEEKRNARRLIEALARHPAYIERAMTGLVGPPTEYWRQTFFAGLLGEARYEPAVDALIAKIAEDEGDFLQQAAGAALIRIGTVGVVHAIEQVFPTQTWSFRLSIGELLEKIKRPETEDALIRMLAGEDDVEVRTFLASGLANLCPTAPQALQTLQNLVAKDDFDSSLVDMEQSLVSAAIMAGYELPNAARRLKEVRAQHADLAARIAAMNRAPKLEYKPKPVSLIETTPIPRSEPPAEPPQPLEPTRPIRRDTAKVGRNDPCPCGSGKKYKKCCEAKA